MKQKLSLIIYIMSCFALGYAILLNSPYNFIYSSWESTRSPILFFPLSIIWIIHIVATGRKQSKEEYSRVIWISSAVLVGTALLLIPAIAFNIHFFLGQIMN